jgi:primase-polymerase (primpol)-like protein
MCEEALDRSGIEGIGFVMNENYYTIRQPNYEGIKDLLTANMKISDTTDFTRSLTVLRHSIQN